MEVKENQPTTYFDLNKACKSTLSTSVDIGKRVIPATLVGMAVSLSLNPAPLLVANVAREVASRVLYPPVSYLADKFIDKEPSTDGSKFKAKMFEVYTTFFGGIACATLATIKLGYNLNISAFVLGIIGAGVIKTALMFADDPFERMNNVQHITTENFQKEVIESDQPVVLDAYASWCPPCKILAPTINELAGELLGEVKFAKFNVDEEPELKKKLQVKLMPTLFFYQNGELVERQEGSLPKEELQAKISSVFFAAEQVA